MNNLQPKKEHKFSFGLWTVGNPGRDPFGEPTRQPISPVTIVKRLSELGAYGVNFHDNDLVPIDASAAERDKIVGEFKKALGDYGMVVPMRPRISSPTPSSRTARSRRTTRASVFTRCKKPCARWTSAPK